MRTRAPPDAQLSAAAEDIFLLGTSSRFDLRLRNGMQQEVVLQTGHTPASERARPEFEVSPLSSQHTVCFLVVRIPLCSLCADCGAPTPLTSRSNGVRKYCAVPIERTHWDRHVRLAEGLEPLPRVFVPEIESAIGTRGGKSAERRVERDTIDRINVLVFSMALERKILAGVTVMYMMDRHATLYGTEAETLLVWEARYTSALILEGRSNCAEDLRWVRHVDNDHLAVSSGDNEQRVSHVHAVCALGQLQDCAWR
eukprot:CAMPEP_0181252026 /NCGR_PEP_ID=MMETSP1096-20121128/47230_1 /TAXON_ID=156174 ORGANISM="Chrysochromulina ericina, Strain CCMP281" /NCGR_SAMPLE_ID=MMETSP1096 /ASSEMBLY_ACC=CAM_ASM_000453 /LENGTH=254 /DNA_ID=CAMNT_0023349727 /DNA_START=390 /DNA_END=1156 /DNA_ORIENTATION=+